ncbi:unnamed protein product [Protopolystoma xenopodis]|uniref:Uncharacterized protein n=1 Tax=Protopolystoma xenopodis TaxID=117903 RepID=A0A3S5AK33_9PLAT|nr:unnamed protein product [Protopolystoma xenopodis]
MIRQLVMEDRKPMESPPDCKDRVTEAGGERSLTTLGLLAPAEMDIYRSTARMADSGVRRRWSGIRGKSTLRPTVESRHNPKDLISEPPI